MGFFGEREGETPAPAGFVHAEDSGDEFNIFFSQTVSWRCGSSRVFYESALQNGLIQKSARMLVLGASGAVACHLARHGIPLVLTSRWMCLESE